MMVSAITRPSSRRISIADAEFNVMLESYHGAVRTDARKTLLMLAQAAGNPVHHLRYRFLTLPVGIQIKIAKALGLFHDEDRGIKDPELFRRLSRRAAERNVLKGLWDAVEAEHAPVG